MARDWVKGKGAIGVICRGLWELGLDGLVLIAPCVPCATGRGLPVTFGFGRPRIRASGARCRGRSSRFCPRNHRRSSLPCQTSLHWRLSIPQSRLSLHQSIRFALGARLPPGQTNLYVGSGPAFARTCRPVWTAPTGSKGHVDAPRGTKGERPRLRTLSRGG